MPSPKCVKGSKSMSTATEHTQSRQRTNVLPISCFELKPIKAHTRLNAKTAHEQL